MLNQGHGVDGSVNGERAELPPSRPYLAVVLLLLVDCTVKRAGEGSDTQIPHSRCDLMFWRKSWFSHCRCVTCFLECHFSPGANVSKRPGVTWTEPAQANSALPQSCATTFPQSLKWGLGSCRRPQPCPPSQGSSTLPGTPRQPGPRNGTPPLRQ